MTDRRRINGPPGGTAPPVFASSIAKIDTLERPHRTRQPNQLRKIFIRTGLTPSASGSAYLEIEPSASDPSRTTSIIPQRSSLKLTCTVHGPRPLPRSAPFSPQLLLSTHVKFAPFATRQRRGFVRDAGERDLAVHLESALRGVIIADRWPKSGVEVIVTILEGEEDCWWPDATSSGGQKGLGGWGMMTVLAGCITVASAAISEAGIDCVDLVSGGVAALVRPSRTAKRSVRGNATEDGEEVQVVLDPCPSEHHDIMAACVVGYLASRDELTEVWLKGDVGTQPNLLIDGAVEAANAARIVLAEGVKESAEAAAEWRISASSKKAKVANTQDVDMS